MDQRIEIINTWTLAKFFEKLENGDMRIPRFQRDFVWERTKVVKLLNSIYSQYPIGTFFLWEADSSMDILCRGSSEFGFPDKPESNKFLFILDGQQRITSLYAVLKGKSFKGVNYKTICFNLDKKIFKIPTLQTEQNNIPVWRIFDDKEYGELLKEYYGSGKMALGGEIQHCHDILNSYPVSIVKSSDMNLDDVVTIFERINQGGKRLTLFNLVQASTWSPDFDLSEKITEFNESESIRFWGSIVGEIFTQSLSLNISGDCTKLHQLGLTNEECKENWDTTIESLRLAIDFVKNLGVQNIDIIPYQSLLVIIQYYFFLSKKKSIDPAVKKLITDWYWTVSYSQRYSSSTLTRINEDALWIKDLANNNLRPLLYKVVLTVEDLKRISMSTSSAIKKALLCLMAMNSPKDFDNGDSVTLDKTNASRLNSKENHHFFPYSRSKDFGVQSKDMNSVLNFAFISKRLNLEISNKLPSKYLTEIESVNENIRYDLASHFIDEKAFNAAKHDDYNDFLSFRGEILLDKINDLCHVGEDAAIIQETEDGSNNEQEEEGY
jgi:hypothetical protein